jgi:HEAT repeat protein
VALLHDESGGVRVRTVDALARLKYKPAIKALTEASVNDEKDYVRNASANALRIIKGNA